jgi:DNA-binding response OmpR family regulator
LAGVEGQGILQGLRKVTKPQGIYIPAAYFQENNVKGFGIGTEDFIAKPFHNPELIACIKSVPGNTSQSHSSQIRHCPDSGIVLDFGAYDKEMEHVQEF